MGLTISKKKGYHLYVYYTCYSIYTYVCFCITGKAVSNSEKEVVYEEPNLSQPVPNKDLGVELKQCPAYSVVQ